MGTNKNARILMLGSVLLLSSCASYHIRQGNRLYEDLAYSQAVVEYQKGLSKKNYPQARERLAASYLKMNDLKNAEAEYSRVVTLPEASAESKLAYARLLMRSGKYDQARLYYDQYLGVHSTDATVRQMRNSCDSISRWKSDSARYSIELSKVNSGGSNFSPVYYRDGIVFVSDRKSKGPRYEWTGRGFLDLYYSKADGNGQYMGATPLQGDLNGIYHDGPACFSSHGDTVYFTRNNYIKKKVKKSDQDEVILKLYMAVKKDTVFGQVRELPFNSNDYSTGHPSLGDQGRTLYFASDMPGGYGGSDLYRSRQENGVWSKPENLGARINTPYNELFPLMWKDSILYFSSEGHSGMGGLDLFRSEKRDTGWTEAVNMGYAMNTGYDDFGIAMNDSGTGGLLSSNRDERNTTEDNIYRFTVNDLRFSLEGIAVEKSTQQPLSGVLVELTNKQTGGKESVLTGPDGTFYFKLNPNTDYSVVGSKDTYFTNTEPVSTVGKNRSESMYVKLKLEMEQIIVNKPIVLENIYYDLDKYEIRADAAAGLDKLVQIMLDNPDIRIELSSHTDSRADDKYNMILSQKRAESAVNYIVGKGISRDRITARGYGETQLVNRCSNGVECTEEEHQANRRTEFKVISIDQKKLSLE